MKEVAIYPAFTFPNVPGGTQYFHVSAQDVAGNWGPSSHYRFLVNGATAAVSVAGGDEPAAK